MKKEDMDHYVLLYLNKKENTTNIESDLGLAQALALYMKGLKALCQEVQKETGEQTNRAFLDAMLNPVIDEILEDSREE